MDFFKFFPEDILLLIAAMLTRQERVKSWLTINHKAQSLHNDSRIVKVDQKHLFQMPVSPVSENNKPIFITRRGTAVILYSEKKRYEQWITGIENSLSTKKFFQDHRTNFFSSRNFAEHFLKSHKTSAILFSVYVDNEIIEDNEREGLKLSGDHLLNSRPLSIRLGWELYQNERPFRISKTVREQAIKDVLLEIQKMPKDDKHLLLKQLLHLLLCRQVVTAGLFQSIYSYGNNASDIQANERWKKLFSTYCETLETSSVSSEFTVTENTPSYANTL